MVEINLLPWRKVLQEKQMRILQLLGVTGCSFLCLLWLILHFYFTHLLFVKRLHAQEVQKQAIQLQQQEQITQVLEKLNTKQLAIYHFFQQIAHTASPPLFLTSLSRHGNEIRLTGKAISMQDITILQHHLSSSILEEVKQVSPAEINFQIKMVVNL